MSIKDMFLKMFEITCPNCNGLMDCIGLCELDKLVYKCRECSKEWI